ncbi:MAG TPA: amidohydrolase family protein [Nocardiopsis listeri]|uniref:amidohydrolase n=1 Tax=Nocardiopsis listeri TaxID=53440 RepID=UPI001D1EB4CC|nr:amidohydrolase family protein [Nocardiopsis listeri]HJE58023.1 amidohydrolase family protein [Nocardiopsis listeri]
MTPDEHTTLINASVPGREGTYDIRLSHGEIEAVVPTSAGARHGTRVTDVDGRFVMPGMWDHHVHFAQWTVQRRRLDLSGTASAAQCLERVRRAVATARASNPADPSPIVGYGFQDGAWPDRPSSEALDEVAPEIPVVLVSKDLHCAWMNTAAARMLTLVPEETTGLVREGEWFGALDRLQSPADLSTDDYREAARAAARRGVVGIVEFENTDNLKLWPERVEQGVDSLRVEVSVWPQRLEGAIAKGVRTGDPLDPRGLITMGPLKVVVDGSLNTRTAWCWDPYPEMDRAHPHACGMETVPLDTLRELMARAKEAGIAAAIHAIGDRANTGVLDAFEELGMTGAIEHAQLVREEDFARFGELGLTASVQPEHAMDDRDVAELHWPGRTGRAFALVSLQRAGATLRLGSDAPVSPLDPWIAISAAVSRSREGRRPWHPEQRIGVESALAAGTRGRVGVVTGEPADLVVVERDPLSCPAEELRTMPVAATLLGGRFTWSTLTH